jgi:hypothetical protein
VQSKANSGAGRKAENRGSFRELLLLLAGLLFAGPGFAAELRLTAPLDYEVIQRHSPTHGVLQIAGRLTSALVEPAVVEARLFNPGVDTPWTAMTNLPAGQTEFRAAMNAPAGGWFQLHVRVRRGAETLAETNVAHVGIGEVFVIAGQSNSANHGERKQRPASDRVAAFSGRHWQPALDPQPGATGSGGSFIPPFADAMAARFNVPVGVACVGVGATSVREWLPRGTRFPNPPTLTGQVSRLENGEWESKGRLFDNLVARMKQLGPGGFRAVLWHQGESDANQRDASRTLPGELYRRFMEQLIRESGRDAGWNPPWFVALVSYHTPSDTGSPDIRAAQAALWKSGLALEGPDSDALAGPLRDGGGRGVHFSDEGLKVHGAKWAEKVAPWLEKQLAAPAKSTGR